MKLHEEIDSLGKVSICLEILRNYIHNKEGHFELQLKSLDSSVVFYLMDYE